MQQLTAELRELTPEELSHLTPQERAAYRKALDLRIAKSGPLAFARYVSPSTEEYAHLVLLNELIVALVEHRLYSSGPGLPGIKDEVTGQWHHPETEEPVLVKLAISMPPRHGKSYLVSEHMPAWYLANNPEKRVILASYEADFAASWGLKARRHLENHPEFGVQLDPSSRAGAKWDLLDVRGGMATAGAGGPLTGKGYHLGIVDDPIKNAEEANSEVHRQVLEDWWHSTFFTRREPDAVTLLMFTRWHEDDLGGRLLGGEEDWYVINLPALAFEETDEDGVSIDIEQNDQRDPLGRRPGEALCPARYTSVQLEALKNSPLEGGRIWFEALYQGRPSISAGGVFSKPEFRYWTDGGSHYELHTDAGIERVPKAHAYRYITIDLAASTKTSADWTVFSLWDALPNGRLVLADRFRERIHSADHLESLKRYLAALPASPKVRSVGVEKSTYGLTLIEQLKRTRGIIVRELPADKDKFSRALPAGQLVTNHQVFFPKNAKWLSVWENELTKFPNSRWDDQVDTFAYAVLVWMDTPVSVREKQLPDTSAEGKIARDIANLEKKGRSRRHNVLGRW